MLLPRGDGAAVPEAVLVAQGVQRFRVLPVWMPGELDNDGQADMPEVRAMKPYYQDDANKETPHPNEKPLALVKKLVTLGTQPGETILDPFAGSGTTGRAAKDLGRKCVLVEREERYCEIAARRMRQEVLAL